MTQSTISRYTTGAPAMLCPHLYIPLCMPVVLQGSAATSTSIQLLQPWQHAACHVDLPPANAHPVRLPAAVVHPVLCCACSPPSQHP
jgi:hypothetical protein